MPLYFYRNFSTLPKQEHPFWEYRRVWAYLKYRERFNINKKRVFRLMKKNNLLVTKENKLKAR